MRQVFFNLYCTTVMILACSTTMAAQDKADISSDSLSCSKTELMTYFPKPLVKNILIKADLSQNQADSISEELAHKSQELEKIVSEKAAKLDPNPFKDLSQRDIAIKIYRETLYEVFAKVLKAHGITDDDRIQTLLDQVQIAKSKMFIDCIRKEQGSFKDPSPPSS
ncbi:hypothetical protein [Candidatus Protochlamydia phocaeensis]|uniref:hypothetical protein n=1 Tax=Candidatus Protochlamydia phocaeensis TaxID=1414722 RepID=UPI000ACE3D31|nr:hypothetical protein [Candidatus Protochlamydia phocaeensis]